MFEIDSGMTSAEGLAAMVAALGRPSPRTDDAARIDRIRLLEELKSAAAAAQAQETADFVASQREQQATVGMPADRIGRGIAAQVGLAKRMSPFHAQRYVGWASILTTELSATFRALRDGRVSEWRAMIVARETAWLSRADRAAVDAELAPRLETLGDRRVEAEARKIAYRLDPEGYLGRIRGASNDRRVTLRPAPDTMSTLTGLLPVAQGVAAYAALTRAADSLLSAGDPRSRGQIMADTLVERVTGQARAGDVPVEINLVMTDQSLLAPTGAGGDEPAQLIGYGPVPAAVARQLVLGPSDDTAMWLRRLYTAPDTGELAAMDSRRRGFAANQRHFLRIRDQHCRTPWCEAPIRHIDHIRPAERGGPTTVVNGQGLCAACNFAKQAPGWRVGPVCSASGVLEIAVTTPTGHTYRSRPPGLPGRSRSRSRPRSELETTLAQRLCAA
jgi:hypothetical protein